MPPLRVLVSTLLGLTALAGALVNGSSSEATTTCGNAYYDYAVTDTSYYFGGGQAGNPDCMYAVKFLLADFGYVPGETEITGFCAGNDFDAGGPWPNQVFLYPDDGGVPDVSTPLAEGTIYTGDGTGQSEVVFSQPILLQGDFWLVLRGDPTWAGEDFNMEADFGPAFGASYYTEGCLGVGSLIRETDDVNYILHANLQSTTGPPPPADCGTAFYDDGSAVGSAWFGGGQAGDPDKMLAVRFDLVDFGVGPGEAELTGFCAGNSITWPLGPWANEVFVYPDDGGTPDETTVLAQGTIYTGDGSGQDEVTLSEPVTLNGDFWLVLRGDPKWTGKTFNLEYDDGPATGHSFVSESGVAGLVEPTFDEHPGGANFILRADLQTPDLVFFSGFENGTTNEWSSSQP